MCWKTVGGPVVHCRNESISAGHDAVVSLCRKRSSSNALVFTPVVFMAFACETRVIFLRIVRILIKPNCFIGDKKMKIQALSIIAMAALMMAASSAWATEYEFTFTGAQLMNYVTANDANGSTPAGNSLYSGAQRFAPTTGNVLYSWTSGTSGAFTTMATTSGYGLADFNFWGFGGTTAAEWGETFSVGSWQDTGTANMGWASGLINNSGTLGNTVLAFGETATGSLITYNDSSTPTFSFTVNLPSTTSWYDNTPGDLVFWFGGDMDNSSGDYEGNLQGNVILQGEVVPEPATMLLFGAGLAGLAALGGRGRRKIS